MLTIVIALLWLVTWVAAWGTATLADHPWLVAGTCAGTISLFVWWITR